MVSVTREVKGLPFAEAGMARPKRGVRLPLLLRLPGIGGRSRGAGDDIMVVMRCGGKPTRKKVMAGEDIRTKQGSYQGSVRQITSEPAIS